MHSSGTGQLKSVETLNGVANWIMSKVPSVNVLRNCFLMNCSVGQDLTEDISQDALELKIEAITGAGVENTEYKNHKTEAIIMLDEIIPFDSEKTCTISDRVIKIIPLRTTCKPGRSFPPTRMGTQYQPEKRAVEKGTPPVVRAEEKPTTPTGRVAEKLDIHLTEEEWQLLTTCHQKEVEDFGSRKTG